MPFSTQMKSRLFLMALLACLASSAVAAGVDSTPARPPNVVLILVDDLGYGDIGPFGATQIRTPALDRMAREGMTFTHFYGASVCSPARAQILTGAYAQRVSIPFVVLPDDRHGLNPAEVTLPERLQALDYATLCIGKWHLGDKPPHLPTHHGFDDYFGLPYDRRIKLPLMRGDQVVRMLEGDDRDRSVELFTAEAERFIRDHRERPFFLYFAHTAVHVPLHPGRDFRGRSSRGLYGDWVEEVDWSVGRVLDALESSGLASNTLVIFTSDNGPWLPYGDEAGTAGPLRGGKGSTWEGGVRVPTIAWWPGRVPAATTRSAVAGTIDLLPTLVTLAGGRVGADGRGTGAPSDMKPRPIDGKDLSPLLFGTSTESPHEAYYYYNVHNLEAVRAGAWKLALRPQIENLGDEHFPPDAAGLQPRLYNLDTDPGERHDVASEHPDVVQRLQGYADTMARDLGDGMPGPGARPAAYADRPM